MRNYFKQKDTLTTPWIESPFFYSLLENSDFTQEVKDMCKFYHENGYLIIDLNLTDDEIQPVVDDMYSALSEEDTTFHQDHYQYTESKRIFELWQKSDAAAELCVNEKVMNTLEILYDRKPYPFSTINFIKGSNQPLHSDVIHFFTNPPLWMVGVWVAFEDVDETNGSLSIVPGSHKWNLMEYEELNLPNPDDVENGQEVLYREYENFLRQLVQEKKAEPYTAKLKKGQALIWASNLLHGGSNVEGVTDFNKTRLTQAQHYFFEGCNEYYHPTFSKKYKGQYASKWCNDTNNIETYLKNGYVNLFDKKLTRDKG